MSGSKENSVFMGPGSCSMSCGLMAGSKERIQSLHGSWLLTDVLRAHGREQRENSEFSWALAPAPCLVVS